MDALLDGGTGNDALSVTAGVGGFAGLGADATVLGGDGDDRLTADIRVGGALEYTAVDISLDGGNGNDRITAAAAVSAENLNSISVSLDGGSGNDRMDLALEISLYNFGYGHVSPDVWDVALRGGDGNDVLGFSTTGLPSNPDGVVLTAADTVLDGGAGNDHITGSVVAETLIDGLGRDTLAGGGGADVFRLAAGDDALDRITGFSGAGGEGDKVDLTLFGADPVVAFAAGILSVDGEDVARISGSFDPATDLILA
jgi:Ca2+-binding RTX toxin-like protein